MHEKLISYLKVLVGIFVIIIYYHKVYIVGMGTPQKMRHIETVELAESRQHVLAAHIRKRFNRTVAGVSALHLNDLVQTADGNFGEFQGISTVRNPYVVRVRLYPLGRASEKGQNVVHLPPTMPYDGKHVQIVGMVMEKPKISEPIPEPQERPSYAFKTEGYWG